ncbi:MAG: DNA N-6-adenine-methyltransferase [Rivularia sp. (in: cyanobacteria)]
MTTLFDIELYQDFEKQGTQRDWDKVFYDPAWDEPNGLTDIDQNKVLGEEEKNLSPEIKCLSGLSDSKFSESITVKSADTEELTPTPRSSIQREQESGLRLFNHSLKAISLWQPYCSLIALGIKQYETRSWKTNYRGKLLICSTAKLTKKQYQQYWKICSSVELPDWNEINFPCGKAIAICDLVDCISITPLFIKEQSETEITSGDWEVGRYAWKLENIQPITEPFAVKGKQGLFNISIDTLPSNPKIAELIKAKESITLIPEDCLKLNTGGREQRLGSNKSLSSDEWYTPPHVSELVTQVLGQISLDPCADEGKHIPAAMHYTAMDDGLIQEWNGRVFINPPYSQPGAWIKKLQTEVASGRVKEAIALIPAATDTKWLSPILKSQPVCFWTGRIKFLDMSYKPRLSARQSHCLVYWGENWERFKEVFDPYGVVYPPACTWVNKNVSTQDAVLTVSSTVSTPEQEETEPVLMVNSTVSTPEQEETEPVLMVSSTVSTHEQEETESVLMVNSTVSTKRRNRGKGTGRIQIRTITKKNGKQYQQAWYDWQIKSGEKTISKSTYIPKRLLPQVQQLEAGKATVGDILKLLE